jgi:hypothetical protein
MKTMSAFKGMLAVLLVLALAGCYPVFNISLYNASDQELRVLLGSEAAILWPSGHYLVFDNSRSTVVGSDHPNVEISMVDIDGRQHQYFFPRYGYEQFRFVSSGRLNENPRSPGIVGNPVRACLHLRIEPDMTAHLMRGGCSTKDLSGAALPAQPPGFPVRPIVGPCDPETECK